MAAETWRRRRLAVLLLALLAAASVPTLREMLRPARLNVIILTVESFRADAVSPALTPNLWAAAAEGVRFTSHRAVSAWTVPNIVAILEGLSPFEQGIHTRGNYLPAAWPLPLKALAAAGWRVSSLQAFASMDVYRNLGLEVEAGADPQAWLARRAAGRQPFVLWYHYLDTHLPYAPPPPFRPDWRALLPPEPPGTRNPGAADRIRMVMTQPAIPTGSVAFQPGDRPAIQALHEGAVRAFDAWFGTLWRFLEDSGLRRNTVLVVTADHGDEHLEHGQLGHASTNRNGHLHEELVHVPLLLWLPTADQTGEHAGWRGQVMTAANDHLDIMPTVLALLGQPPPRPLPGVNLLALPPAGHIWSAVTSKAGFADPDPEHITEFIAARLDGPWKLHLRQRSGVTGDPVLYNLEDDPGETTDIAAIHPEVVARLRPPLAAELAAMRPPTAGDGTRPEAARTATQPHWLVPAGSGPVSAAEVAGGFSLRWTGDPGGHYAVDYRAGNGAHEVDGRLEVDGTIKAFGAIDRKYWETFILPYGQFRLRVGVAGRDDLWSDWITLTAVP